MSVELEIDLKAEDVEGGILGIAGALETLDDAADGLDLDVDLDDIDVGEITGDIGNTISELQELDDLLTSIEESGSNIGDFDDITHKVKHEHEDAGSTNNGDSTGGDPPGDDETSYLDSRSFRERVFGEGPLITDTDLGNLWMRTKMGSNFGKHAPDSPEADIGGRKFTGQDTGFGMESAAMQDRRMSFHEGLDLPFLKSEMGGDISLEEYASNSPDIMPDQNPDPTPTLDSGVKEMLREYKTRQANLRDNVGVTDGIFDIEGGKLYSGDAGSDADWAGQRRRNTASVPIPDDAHRNVGLSPYMDRIDGDGSLFSRVDKIRSKSDGIDALGNEMGNIDGVLRKFKPSLGKYMQLLAAIIPIAVALAPALLGVAGAMGAVAASGAAFIGLGLLGHAQSFEGAMADAQERVRGLKRDLFDTFQPAMQSFAPIQARAFDAIPQALDPIAEKMEELTVFEGAFFRMGSMLANGLEMSLGIILANQNAVENLATSFTRLVSTGLLEFFNFLFKAADNNKNLLVDIGSDFASLIGAAYNFTVAITRVISAFSPLVTIVYALSELLRNDLLKTFASIVGWMYVLGKSALLIYGLAGAFMTLTGWVAKAVAAIWSYELSTWGAVAATMALAGAMALVTAGVSAIAGSLASGATINGGDSQFDVGNGRGVGGGTVINDNRSYRVEGGGNMDYATQKGVQREIEKGSESTSAREYPDIELNSTESDSDSTK
jgi:hypothetical protein